MLTLGFQGGTSVEKNQPTIAGRHKRQFLGEESTATHHGILTWRIPWTEEPGGLWSMGSQRVGHD